MKLQAAKTLTAAKTLPALKMVPATKMESAKSVSHGGLTYQQLLMEDKNIPSVAQYFTHMRPCLCVFQSMMRVKESPTCAICEFVMKQLEDTLKDEKTEVRHM